MFMLNWRPSARPWWFKIDFEMWCSDHLLIVPCHEKNERFQGWEQKPIQICRPTSIASKCVNNE